MEVVPGGKVGFRRGERIHAKFLERFGELLAGLLQRLPLAGDIAVLGGKAEGNVVADTDDRGVGQDLALPLGHVRAVEAYLAARLLDGDADAHGLEGGLSVAGEVAQLGQGGDVLAGDLRDGGQVLLEFFDQGVSALGLAEFRGGSRLPLEQFDAVDGLLDEGGALLQGIPFDIGGDGGRVAGFGVGLGLGGGLSQGGEFFAGLG